MSENLLKEWSELQHVPARDSGSVENKANREIAIAESLEQAGYAGQLNGFSLQFIIADRQRAMREMSDRLRSI